MGVGARARLEEQRQNDMDTGSGELVSSGTGRSRDGAVVCIVWSSLPRAAVYKSHYHSVDKTYETQP